MATAKGHCGNLPAEASSFIGRRRELAELRARLATARLVSLVGPGGVGKTRLALRAATGLARGFTHGAWLVGLAEVHTEEGVLRATAEALGLRDQGAVPALDLVTGYLADRELLLVVDNCEHVLAPAAEIVTAVLAAAPRVRVIATSREPLSVGGEHVLPVPPLELPQVNSTAPVERVGQNEAVRLFTERAAAASGRFVLTEANRAAVIGICRRLDGLPLALELAAVKTRVLAVEQILAHLSDRFALLGSDGWAALPRHQTLRTAIDWSYGLLTDEERVLLRRLSVFAGRFTLDDARGACADGDLPARHVLSVLASLVGKSLVMTELVGPVACHRLHETMREYAAERLADAGEEPASAERLIDYYVTRCAAAVENARPQLVDWLEWVELEIDTIRLVLRRCRDRGDSARQLALVGSLAWWWVTRAQAEGIALLDDLIAAYPRGSAELTGAHFMRGFLAVLRSDPATGRRELGLAVESARRAGPARLLIEALSMASVAAGMTGDAASSQLLLEEALAVAAGHGDGMSALATTQAQAMRCFFAGDLAGFRAASLAGVRLSRELNDLYTLEIWLMNLGLAALIRKDENPEPLLVESLTIAQRIDDRVAQFYLVGALGCQAARSGQPGRAARLLGASDSLRALTGAAVNALLGPIQVETVERLRAGLGEAKYDAEWAMGACLDRDGALTLALGPGAERSGGAGVVDATPLLTPRETEIASHLVEGLSNRQIGSRLFLSERTVENHIRNIMNKLGVSTRAQIAGWAATTLP